MRQKTWLEDSREVGGGHSVEIRLGCENREEIENIQKELSVERRQVFDELLIRSNSLVVLEDSVIRLGDRCFTSVR